MGTILAGALAALVFGGGAAGQAQAAPQVLGLIAMAEPMEMQCDRTRCHAELTTFCMEQKRAQPTRGTAYDVGAGEGIRLVGVLADGRRMSLAAGDLEIRSYRGHTSVMVTVSAALKKQHGLTGLLVSVGEKTALVPEPTIGDPDPHTPEQLATAFGPLRKIGAEVVDADAVDTKAADYLNRVVNRLPLGGRVDRDAREGLFGKVHGTRASSPALSQAAEAHGRCARQVYLGNQKTMRGCLSAERDQWLTIKTQEFWAHSAGS
ncbi:MAG: hypothetical protein NXI16_08765 [Alphaproteobacteria bacterium]|nr:hypothetical protein [Alphaproteobacteria bacterium]